MIHGSGLNARSWDALAARLTARGWPRDYLLAVDLRPNDGANISAAETQLQSAARHLLKKAGNHAQNAGVVQPKKIAVIGHSMGAVSGRWLAGHLVPERVALFISIAGANHGTNALCGHTGEGNRELCPAFADERGSAVQAALNGTPPKPVDETPYGPAQDPSGAPTQPPTPSNCIAWYTIMIDPDEWIVPARSAQLAGVGGPARPRLPSGIERISAGEFLVAKSVRHDDLPSDPDVVDLIQSLLEEGGSCGPQ